MAARYSGMAISRLMRREQRSRVADCWTCAQRCCMYEMPVAARQSRWVEVVVVMAGGSSGGSGGGGGGGGDGGDSGGGSGGGREEEVMVKVKSSMARSLPVKNLLPQKVGSIINYLQ